MHSTKLAKGLEHMTSQKKVREMCLFSLEKGRLTGLLSDVYSYLTEAHRKEKRVFPEVDSSRMRGNRNK